MQTVREVGVFVGSLRRDSLNRRLAAALPPLAPPTLRLEPVAIDQLPFYNPDFEDSLPEAVKVFRARLKRLDALLFVTPEYNRSVPAVLKNALDTGSRPFGQNVWAGKPGAIITSSQGALGGFGANHHLRQSLVFLDVPTLQQPEAYIGHSATLFGADGTLANESTREFLKKFLETFGRWVERHAAR